MKNEMGHRFTVPLLLIVLVLLVVFGAATTQLNDQQNQPLPPEPTPSISVSPSTQMQIFTDDNFKFSFQYPAGDDRGVLKVIPYESGEAQTYMVGYQNSDIKILGIAVYTSSLSASQWWQQVGYYQYAQMVQSAHDAVQPTVKPYVAPTFTTSVTTVGGQPAFVARGILELNQGGGDTILSVVSKNGLVYVFEQPVDELPNQDALQKSTAILQTVTFNDASPEVQRCGGNMANAKECPTGYHCAPDPTSHLPFGDVGGFCVKN